MRENSQPEVNAKWAGILNVENIPTWLPVVALALRDGAGRLLLQQRAADKHHGGLWEFPGGKVEVSEKPRLALVREIDEELGLVLDPDRLEPAGFAEEEGARHIVLFLYSANSPNAEPVAMDGQQWGWFQLDEASQLPLAPMDRELLARLSP
ncbi:NUDIX domain-containing protein [Aurantiacibacter sediminis]|uniref:8-oxo-dGTP diphosphatase n=1 Tax=Aurantiacibacter sediminis TaxID=2793064 RepID=A0ABS0N4C5_9SPHN|nr:NUDIX domain-containing protein [Aurantiacibacter sediminis]MBH5322821.1 NUDIX domain-containing protein [Aurantiacibacter sediminis]